MSCARNEVLGRDGETNTAVDDDVIEAVDTYVARSRKHDADRELDAAFERQVARRE